MAVSSRAQYMAAACLYLAGKVEEQPKKVKDLVPLVAKLRPRGEPLTPQQEAELADSNSKVRREREEGYVCKLSCGVWWEQGHGETR